MFNKTYRPDVYIIVLDSVSSSMAKRSLPKTIEFLKSEMAGVLFEFLNKVGTNSKGNGIAMAFGKSIEGGSRAAVGLPPLIPDWNRTEYCEEYLDKHNYHLHQYKDVGYKTMVAQDGAGGVAFYPNCKGFERAEADHIWRPMELRIEGSRIHRAPKIAQIWPTNLAHESVKDLYHSDEHFLSFFQSSEKNLEDAFVFFMGDHGPRRDGIQETAGGAYETNNPLLLITVPLKYRKSKLIDQLRNKTHQLLTPFDIHATLMDILKFQPQSNFEDTSFRNMEPISKGSSLLRLWKGVRNCRVLPIPPQYCLCQYKRTKVRDPELMELLGNLIANKVNDVLRQNELTNICLLQHFLSAEKVLYLEENNVVVYTAEVRLQPSQGLFEAHILSNGSAFEIVSGFTRRDTYGNQGKCIFGTPYEPICQCRETANL
ncbi:hypothetical protein Q1695_009647 [Nippostrongylus brasiliensis]|nr:hypothetical protein Q1695_009647 [Nippostrongylus brasiliensis]